MALVLSCKTTRTTAVYRHIRETVGCVQEAVAL